MNLQVSNTDVSYDFPLQLTGSTPVSGETVKPVSDKLQYRVKVSYTVKARSPQQP